MKVGAPNQAREAQGKLLVEELEQAEMTLEVDVEAVEQDSRKMVVVPATAQAELRLILQ